MEEKVLKLLSEKLPEIDFTASDTLIDDGILDSLTITTVIAELSVGFGVLIPFEEISEDNFNSVSAIAALVEKYRKKE
ncbi:MAG: acyl carrier protein [Oscillospiraceae bacterium]|nr:acyl carrier protein [Oscillospiraceae bacterium]